MFSEPLCVPLLKQLDSFSKTTWDLVLFLYFPVTLVYIYSVMMSNPGE